MNCMLNSLGFWAENNFRYGFVYFYTASSTLHQRRKYDQQGSFIQRKASVKVFFKCPNPKMFLSPKWIPAPVRNAPRPPLSSFQQILPFNITNTTNNPIMLIVIILLLVLSILLCYHLRTDSFFARFIGKNKIWKVCYRKLKTGEKPSIFC